MAESSVEVPRVLLEALVDTGDCYFDHHGGCQGHGYLDLDPGEECPQATLKRTLATETPVPAEPDFNVVTAERRCKYRVAVNPTGEQWGVVASSVVVGREMAERVVAHYVEHFPPGEDGKGFVVVDDSPEFGAEHSDVYLRLTAGGRSGRWAEPLACSVCMVAGHLTDWRCVTPVDAPSVAAGDGRAG